MTACCCFEVCIGRYRRCIAIWIGQKTFCQAGKVCEKLDPYFIKVVVTIMLHAVKPISVCYSDKSTEGTAPNKAVQLIFSSSVFLRVDIGNWKFGFREIADERVNYLTFQAAVGHTAVLDHPDNAHW